MSSSRKLNRLLLFACLIIPSLAPRETSAAHYIEPMCVSNVQVPDCQAHCCDEANAGEYCYNNTWCIGPGATACVDDTFYAMQCLNQICAGPHPGCVDADDGTGTGHPQISCTAWDPICDPVPGSCHVPCSGTVDQVTGQYNAPLCTSDPVSGGCTTTNQCPTGQICGSSCCYGDEVCVAGRCAVPADGGVNEDPCDPGEAATIDGDPIDLAFGGSTRRIDDVRLPSRQYDLDFTRRYTSDDTVWRNFRLLGDDGGVPQPFGTWTPDNRTLRWWHNYFSFIRDTGARWVVVGRDGRATPFLKCLATGVDCWGSLASEAHGDKVRLERLASGAFVAYFEDGVQGVYDVAWTEAGAASPTHYFLRQLLDPSGSELAHLEYDSSVNACSGIPSTGGPFLRAIVTSEAAVRLLYKVVARRGASGVSQCVLGSVVDPDAGVNGGLVLVSYDYDAGASDVSGLLMAATNPLRTEGYSYDGGFSVSRGAATMIRHEYGVDNRVGHATWPGTDWTIAWNGQGTDLVCGVPVNVVALTDNASMAGNGLDAGVTLVRTVETVALANQKLHPRVFREITSCGGSQACSPGTVERTLGCPIYGEPVGEIGVKDKRGNWTAYSRRVGSPAQQLETSRVIVGAAFVDGGQGLEYRDFDYAYTSGFKQLLSSESELSVLGGAGSKTTTSYSYTDSGRRAATVRTGFTNVWDSSTNSFQTRQLVNGFFELTARTFGDLTAPDDRVRETHGPCWMNAATDTDCTGESYYPVTQFFYGGPGEGRLANRLKEVKFFPSGTQDLSKTFSVYFTDYDSLGQVTRLVDPNNVATILTYDGLRLASKTVGNAPAITYGYDSAGHLAYVQHRPGNYEVFCYRDGGPGCVGNMTDRLRWKAKSATSDGASFSEKVEYVYWSDGTVKSESYKTASGEVRRVVYYAADAQRRQTMVQKGSGATAYTARWSYDGADNRTGIGFGFNAPPAWCGVGPDGQPVSTLCANLFFDRANRLSRLDETASSTSGAKRTCIRYDGHGNVASIEPGLANTVDCGATSAGAGAIRYQYDDFGNVVAVTNPDFGGASAGVTSFAYNAAGDLAIKQTPAMLSASAADHLEYVYDKLSRLTTATHYTGTGSELLYEYAYDNPGGCTVANTLGRLAKRHDSFGWTWLSYDQLGNVVSETRIRNENVGSCTSVHNEQTTYAYDALYRLSQVTYPYQRRVTYAYGAGADAERIVGIKVGNFFSFFGIGQSDLDGVLNVMWEPYGGVRAYAQYHRTSQNWSIVENRLGSVGSQQPTTCANANNATDQTGRIGAVWVTASTTGATYTVDQGTGDIFKQAYGWTADQLTGRATCLLGSNAQSDNYSYDRLLRLTNSSGSSYAPIVSRAYAYDARGNETGGGTDGKTFATTYDSSHPDRILSRYNSATGKVLGWQWTWDVDGRVAQKRSPAESTGHRFTMYFTSGPGGSGAADSVYQAVRLGDGTGNVYNYFYDDRNHRRRKEYPSGVADEYFYDVQGRLIVDRGNTSTTGGDYPMDEYVWLDDTPIAVVRGKLHASDWTRYVDATSDCTRIGDPATTSCGLRTMVNDPIGRMVLAVDMNRRISGVGEYNPQGLPNRALTGIESNHPYAPLGTPTGPISAGSFTLPTVANMNLTAHVLFDLQELHQKSCGGGINGWDGIDIYDPGTATVLYSALGGGGSARGWSSWFTPVANTTLRVDNNVGDCTYVSPGNCTCNQGKNEKGIASSYVEYQRFQSGGQAFWPLMRLRGQYYDPETDLFENWNRFYDPAIGRYGQTEPLLQVPDYMLAMAREGRGIQAYAYAANSPLRYVDLDGREIVAADARAAEMLDKARQSPFSGALVGYLEDSPYVYRITGSAAYPDVLSKAGKVAYGQFQPSVEEGRVKCAPGGRVDLYDQKYPGQVDPFVNLMHELTHAALFDAKHLHRPGLPSAINDYLGDADESGGIPVESRHKEMANFWELNRWMLP